MASSCGIDSDEEDVFWGPVTMKEIKATFKKELAELKVHRSTGKLECRNLSPSSAKISGPDAHKENLIEEEISNRTGNKHISLPHRLADLDIGSDNLQPDKDTLSDSSKETARNSINVTPISSPIKEDGASTYNTPSLMSPSQNDCDSSFASVASSFVDESDSPNPEIASESFEKVDPSVYNNRATNDLDSIGFSDESKYEAVSVRSSVPADEVSLSNHEDSISFKSSQSGSVTGTNNSRSLPQTEQELAVKKSSTSSAVEKNAFASCSSGGSTSDKTGPPNVTDDLVLMGNSESDSPSWTHFQATDSPLKPLNNTQFTEADLSNISPPNSTVFDDTIMSLNQDTHSTSPNLDHLSKSLGKSTVERVGDTPILLDNQKKKSYDTLPKPFSRKDNCNSIPTLRISSIKTPIIREPTKFGKTPPSHDLKKKLLSSRRLNKNSSYDQEITLENPSLTSSRKGKFFSTPETVRHASSNLKERKASAKVFDPKFDRLSPSTPQLSLLSSVGSITKKNGSCEKVISEPKRKFFPASCSTKIPSRPAKPKIVTPKLNQGVHPDETVDFSKNDTSISAPINSVKRSKIPATSIPKFFPRSFKEAVRNQENLLNSSPKSEDSATPAAKYTSDSSLPLSDASFNSSINSNKSLTSGIPKPKSVADIAGKLVKTRLPRLNDLSRIPKVNSVGFIQHK